MIIGDKFKEIHLNVEKIQKMMKTKFVKSNKRPADLFNFFKEHHN